MVKYLSVFFICIVVITGFILCFNPSMHKSVSIAGSKSKISMENKETVVHKKDKTQNIDNINAQDAAFKNVDNISLKENSFNNTDNISYKENSFSNIDNITTSETNFNNQDNIHNTGVNINPYDNTTPAGAGFSNTDTSSPYVQKIKEREGWQHPGYEEPEPTPRQRPQLPPQQPRQRPKRPSPDVENPAAVRNTAPPGLQQQESEPEDVQISWNIWRSNLGNYIADDFEKWASVNGTYMFYFTVDNRRQISNPVIIVVGMASNESRMAAYRYLYNLSGSSILQFPAGSKREKVNAIYSIYIGDNVDNSSLNSSDFSDYETIR